MYYTEKDKKDGRDGDVQTMRKHKREESLQMLISEVSELLNQTENEQLVWHGSQTDLMEALHTAYLFGNLHNDQGQPCTFKEIVNHACRLFAHPVPSNPTALASRGRYRKGVKRQSFFDRYCLLQSHGKGCRPLLQLVSKAP
jgi:hypothetical protein